MLSHRSSHSKNCKSALAEKSIKNGNQLFYPSAKSRTELKLGLSGVVFRGRRASGAQKFIVPPKRRVLDSTSDFFANFFRHFFFRRRKMKCRESSETRFGQVSRRSEPSSRGKRPLKVCRVRCRAGFSSPTRVGDRFDLCRGIPYALRQA